MISREQLNSVKKIVVHKFCHDGTSSAMIIKDVLPDVEVIFAGHKDKEYLELPAEEGLLFCDIAPPPGREQEFIDVKSIVLDHHVKCEPVIKLFESQGLGVYGETDDGVSGAVLAYRHVWCPLEDQAKTDKKSVCRLARLAGIRDTWQKDSIEWDEALLQTEALAFYPAEHFLDDQHPVIILEEELKIASITLDRSNSFLKRITDSAFIIHWGKLKVGIIPGHRVISDVAENLRKEGIPVTFAFSFKLNEFGTPCMTASIRSDGSFDCNKFAGKFSGGGHIKAAGSLTVDIKDDTLNPYSCIQNLLNKYGEDCLIQE